MSKNGCQEKSYRMGQINLFVPFGKKRLDISVPNGKLILTPTTEESMGEFMRVKTKEDALLHCFDLWLWLALNPGMAKGHWPGWDYLEPCQSNCPCCEYAYQEDSCQ